MDYKCLLLLVLSKIGEEDEIVIDEVVDKRIWEDFRVLDVEKGWNFWKIYGYK